MYSVGLIIVSDSCFNGQEDLTGPALVKSLNELDLYGVNEVKIVPDEVNKIQAAVLSLSHCPLIFTAGGTGFSPRDVTPEVGNLES